MSILTAPKCVVCRHFRPTRPGSTCAACPEGIPEDILLQGFDHRQRHSGDNGIVFEPDTDPKDADIMLAHYDEAAQEEE